MWGILSRPAAEGRCRDPRRAARGLRGPVRGNVPGAPLGTAAEIGLALSKAYARIPRLKPMGPRADRRFALLLATAFALAAAPGCGPKRIKADFSGFENAYAWTSNHEMLLNLARLANHDPTFFFKVGQISASYRIQAGLTGSGTYVPQGTNGANVTGGGSPNLVYESNPAFTFIPVNDQTNAELLMRPVPPESFYALFQQGWRLDQLFRLMVDRIELTTSTGTACQTEVIHNSPSNLGDYARFLRISAILYVLQQRGYLLLRGENTFVPYDKESFLPASPPAADSPAGKTIGQRASGPNPAHPPDSKAAQENPPAPAVNAANFTDAWSKTSSVWEKTHRGWQLGQEVFGPMFLLNAPYIKYDPRNPACQGVKAQDKVCPDTADIVNVLKADPLLKDALREVPALPEIVVKGLSKGFSIENRASAQETSGTEAQLPCQTESWGKAPGVVAIHLVLRSLIGMMAAAAQEQAAFDRLSQSTSVPADPLLTALHVVQPEYTFGNSVPPLEQLPLLTLTWKQPEIAPPLEPLIPPFYYKGSRYLLADFDYAKFENSWVRLPPEDETWNLDMFRLISQLAAQVTVDISKFPLPEILQLRTQ